MRVCTRRRARRELQREIEIIQRETETMRREAEAVEHMVRVERNIQMMGRAMRPINDMEEWNKKLRDLELYVFIEEGRAYDNELLNPLFMSWSTYSKRIE
jgi:hypothetical protein